MATTSETGHPINIANLNLLNKYILEIGSIYNPSNPKLVLSNLQYFYTTAYHYQKNVNDLLAPYSFAVDERELIFKPLNRDLTKLRKAYLVTDGVTPAQLEDFMTIIRKLKGVRKSPTKTTNPDEPQTRHSVSQLSYDQRTNNMGLLIALLQNTPNYNPNEIEFQVATYQFKKMQMLEKTQAVAAALIPLNHARSLRNNFLYHSEENLIELANKAKEYLFTILDPNSVQYKAIAKIKFKKR